MEKARDFELVSKYVGQFRDFKMPVRSTKFSAGYDIFNNTGKEIIVRQGGLSDPITTFVKAYMLPNEFLSLHVRSGHGFKYSLKLANSVGIIDCDYYNNPNNEGEIFVRFHNQGTFNFVIKPGEGMCQAIFSNYLITDSDVADGVRQGGLGSTSLP